MKQSKYFNALLLGLISSMFLACGGGTTNTVNSLNELSNDMTATQTEIIPNQKPIANAGEDRNISFAQPVILDASKSSDINGSIVKYEWYNASELISDQPSVVMDTLEEGTYTFTLVVTDDENATDSDTVKIMTYSDVVVVLQTNHGDIELKMMSDIAPKAVENFTTHSKNGYYDGITFHRVIKDFMIQGGDPLGTGYGGESIWGTAFEDEVDPNVLFDRPFLLAMANAGPNTNGSQFFITTKEADFLNGNYTIFGEVIEGTETVTVIENVPTGYADKPKEDQLIVKAYVKFEAN